MYLVICSFIEPHCTCLWRNEAATILLSMLNKTSLLGCRHGRASLGRGDRENVVDKPPLLLLPSDFIPVATFWISHVIFTLSKFFYTHFPWEECGGNTSNLYALAMLLLPQGLCTGHFISLEHCHFPFFLVNYPLVLQIAAPVLLSQVSLHLRGHIPLQQALIAHTPCVHYSGTRMTIWLMDAAPWHWLCLFLLTIKFPILAHGMILINIY